MGGVVIAGLCLSACRETPPLSGLHGLHDQIVTTSSVVVTPDTDWRVKNNRIGFAREGALLVWFADDATDAVELRLRAARVSHGRRLRFTLDGDPVGSGEIRLGATPLVVVVDPIPGGRRLELEVPAGEPATPPVVFSRLEMRVASAGEPWVEIRSRHLLAAMLDSGVAGPGQLKWSGCLFVGPGRTEHRFAAITAGSVSLDAVNGSSATAVFRARLDDTTTEVEVPPDESRPIEIPVESGPHSLELEIRGDPAGDFLWGAPLLRQERSDDRPHVVLVTLDTTRRDAVPPWSEDTIAPTLERVARSATVFDHATATAPWTLPTHASMFTGLYPSEHRAGVTADRLPADSVTAASLLRESGYVTAGFAGGSLAGSHFGLARGFSVYRDPDGFETPADVLTDAALALVGRYSGAPLFLFVNYFDPHGEYAAPEKFEALFNVQNRAAAVADLPVWRSYADGDTGAWNRVRTGRAGSPPAGLELLRAKYLAEVAFMDGQLGRLLGVVEALDRETLLIIVADHGELLGERGRFTHSYWLDPELVEIPLMIRWPDGAAARRRATLVSQVDLFPTVLRAAGLVPPSSSGHALDGGDAAALAARGEVWTEEHAARVHQLSNRLKLADHLVGRLQAARREIGWPGGAECAEGGFASWIAVPCAVGFAELVAAAPEAVAATIVVEAGFTAADLSPDDAARLRALGYLD